MKRIILFAVAALFVSALTGCEPVTNTTNTVNTANANTAKPAGAPPTKEALLAMDKQATEAWVKGDAAFFEGMLSDKFVMHEGGQAMGKADLVKMIGTFKCDVKSWELNEDQMMMIDPDTAVTVYKGTFDGTCDGQKIPSPVRAASVYVRNGDKWQGVYHGEVPIAEAGAAPPAATSPEKKDAAPAERPAANANTSSAANTNSNTAETKPAAPTPSANTDALTKRHIAGWEAWKNKDTKWFEANTASNLAVVNPIGEWIGTKAAVIKAWTDMQCEGITKVNFTNAFATALSPTVEMLSGTGSADGTCNGQKNADLHHTAFYVKEGNEWKLAFMFETPARK